MRGGPSTRGQACWGHSSYLLHCLARLSFTLISLPCCNELSFVNGLPLLLPAAGAYPLLLPAAPFRRLLMSRSTTSCRHQRAAACRPPSPCTYSRTPQQAVGQACANPAIATSAHSSTASPTATPPLWPYLRQRKGGVHWRQPWVAHERQAGHPEEGVVHIHHVLRPVRDAAPRLVLRQRGAPALNAKRQGHPATGLGAFPPEAGWLPLTACPPGSSG